jgi:hypothetical protein
MLKKQKSLAELKTASLVSFALPENFCVRIQDLEIQLHENKLTHFTMKELFELYSVKY